MNPFANMNKKLIIFGSFLLAAIVGFTTVYFLMPSRDKDEFNPFEQSEAVISKIESEESPVEEANAESDELVFTVQGEMGDCGTRLTFNSSKGYLAYNTKGRTLIASHLENRDVSLVSYDPGTKRLVLEVRKSGKKTGELDGVYANGTYEGQFKNVNGQSSSFSFKK